MPNPDDIDKQTSSRLSEIFPSPQVARAVIIAATSKRPIGSSHRSHYPYYQKCYADAIKPFIDGMIANKQDIIYKYDVWCTEQTAISKQTLYFRINQSIRYLCDRMDTDDKTYDNWRRSVNVMTKRGVGIIITYKTGIGLGDDLQPEFVHPQSSSPKWRRKLDEWLESDDVESFNQEQLALSPDEIRQLKIEMAGLKGIMADVQMGHIKILRVNV